MAAKRRARVVLFAVAFVTLAGTMFALVRMKRGERGTTVGASPSPDITPRLSREDVKVVRTADGAAKIAYLAARLEQSEKRCTGIQLRYTWSQIMPSQTLTSNCMWAVQGGLVRHDETKLTDANLEYRYLSDGKTCRQLNLWKQAGEMKPVMMYRGRADGLSAILRYEDWACFTSDGKPISRVIRERALSAAKRGRNWEVRLAMSGHPGWYEVLTLRPDRDYRAESRVRYRPDKTEFFPVRVTHWIGGKGKPWLPGAILAKADRDTTIKVLVSSAVIGEQLPKSVFSLGDDGRIGVFDFESNRVVRQPKQDALTDAHLVRVLEALRRAPTATSPGDREAKLLLNTNTNFTGYCGLQCLWIVGRLQGKPVPWADLYQKHLSPTGEHSFTELKQIAHDMGIEMEGYAVSPDKVDSISVPFIGYATDKKQGHFYVVTHLDDNFAYLFNPPSHVMRFRRADLVDPGFWQRGFVLALKQ